LTKQEKQGTLVVREDKPLEAQVEMATEASCKESKEQAPGNI
jgi:hypothetical protein